MSCNSPHSNSQKEHQKLLEKEPIKEKRRRRPLTKGLRSELRTLLENAILDSDSALLSSVFSQDDTTLVAPLSAVLFYLQELGHNITRFNVLSNFALESTANRTRIFTIENKEKQLLVRINPHIRMHNDEKTVFVDNLPPFCTSERLKKRAEFFGRVVNIRMPQIGRLQRRIAQMIGGVWPVHSGFAFVQFVSKTAAKRFCKRYATNSRLKRIHHHGHKHGRKRAMPGTVKNIQQKSGEITEEQTSGGEVVMESADSKTGKDADLQKALCVSTMAVASAVFEPTLPPPLLPLASTVVSNPNTSNYFLSSGNNADVRIRCNSVAEDSVISESGNETDTQMGKMREDDKVKEKMGGERKGKGEKKRRRRRRRNSAGQRQLAIHQQSLNSLFRHIQVFPLKQYRELRMDYLRIKKMRMGTLKKQLVGTAKDGEEQQKEMDNRKEETEGRKGERTRAEKKVKKRRKRGRGVRKLLGKAEHTKVAEYRKDQWTTNNEL
ncbi:hypothetical protein niasHS_003485 [Heterodera schachtii]|uniref:RRM domain-containing protein n=1 Tax=Heterodera schachtii TaxID=97005 RepID=A0ABD2KGP1_HETSC